MDRMNRFLNAKGGIGFFLISLALTFFVFLNLSILGCGGGCSSSTTTYEATATTPAIDSSMDTFGDASVIAGQEVALSLDGNWADSGTGTMIWSPPAGVTNFQFQDAQPQPGGPPFVFENLTAGQASHGIMVYYQVPEDYPYDKVIDTLEVRQGDKKMVSVTSHAVYSDQAPARAQAHPNRKPFELKAELAPSDPHAVWQVIHFQDVEMDLDQQGCRDIVAQAKSPNSFAVWQVPVADAVADGESHMLPVVHTNGSRPMLVMLSGPLNLEMPMEVRQDATAWANEHLPAVPGSLWVALGVDPTATIAECPVMSITSFSMMTQFRVDLSSRPQGCVGCVLQNYTCYKTGEGSLLPAGAAAWMAANKAGVAYGDFTCVGPGDTTLSRDPDWQIEDYTNTLLLKPGDPMTIHYWAYQNGSTPLQLSLTPASTLPGVSWVGHPALAGNDWELDPSKVLGSSITVPADGSKWFHMYFQGTVPANAAPGQYRFTMTMANPSANPTTLTGETVLVVTADGNLPGAADLVPGVSLEGRAAATQALPGQNLNYYLTIENTGPEALTNLVLSDALPAKTSFVSCAGGDSCANNAGAVTWNLAALPAGQSHVMMLVVKVDAAAKAGENITNAAYSVQTGQSVSDTGASIITPVGSSTVKVFLSYLAK